ncbi:MAG TPA: guanylate kinase [Syntrophomonadaceae bacterium]|nr:guanylate kinase [Syntrophomonadaceae bacterium]
MTAKPLLIVVSGPSGSGKGTLCTLLRQRLPDLAYSVSVTTRPPRPGERNGVDYFFVSTDEFLDKIKAGEFLEWARVYDNYYGTPISYVKDSLQYGKDVLLELDIQGANQVKKLFPDAVLIFIRPPSLEELGARITKRGTDSQEAIRKRLSSANQELQAASGYDYVVVNDRQERALEEMMEIIRKEKARRSW